MSVKTELRDSVSRLFFRSGLTHPARRGRERLSIVTFHRVLSEAERERYPYPGLVVTPEELSDLLSYFSQHFDCGPLSTQHERYLRGEDSERPLLAVTFDDAQFDNYFHAQPVLAHYGIKASMFAPVSAVERQELLWHDRLGFSLLALLGHGTQGKALLASLLSIAEITVADSVGVESVVEASKRLSIDARERFVDSLVAAAGMTQFPDFARLMTFEELGELAMMGHEIGSHSMSHSMMPQCDDEMLKFELAESRRVLEQRLGRPIETFCYPNGDCDARCARAVAEAGYQRAVTTSWGINGRDSDRFQLRRCDMDVRRVRNPVGKVVPATVAFRMSGLYPGLG